MNNLFVTKLVLLSFLVSFFTGCAAKKIDINSYKNKTFLNDEKIFVQSGTLKAIEDACAIEELNEEECASFLNHYELYDMKSALNELLQNKARVVVENKDESDLIVEVTTYGVSRFFDTLVDTSQAEQIKLVKKPSLQIDTFDKVDSFFYTPAKYLFVHPWFIQRYEEIVNDGKSPQSTAFASDKTIMRDGKGLFDVGSGVGGELGAITALIGLGVFIFGANKKEYPLNITYAIKVYDKESTLLWESGYWILRIKPTGASKQQLETIAFDAPWKSQLNHWLMGVFYQ